MRAGPVDATVLKAEQRVSQGEREQVGPHHVSPTCSKLDARHLFAHVRSAGLEEELQGSEEAPHEGEDVVRGGRLTPLEPMWAASSTRANVGRLAPRWPVWAASATRANVGG